MSAMSKALLQILADFSVPGAPDGSIGSPTDDPDIDVPLVVGLLSGFGSFLLVIFLACIYLCLCTSTGSRWFSVELEPDEEERISEERLRQQEQQALPHMTTYDRENYLRARIFQQSIPPNLSSSELSPSDRIAVTEKGLAAWSFQTDAFSYDRVHVSEGTDVDFFDTVDCSVVTNLPFPRSKDTHYLEVKIAELPAGTKISIGAVTTPYPTFTMPGSALMSIGYESTGHVRVNEPFDMFLQRRPPYPPLQQGDVVGLAWKHHTGTFFFTHNGKKLPDCVSGWKKFNMYPALGSNGPCSLWTNFGQRGYVFIQANVERWGFAGEGTLGVPPNYNDAGADVLLEAASEMGPSAGSAARTDGRDAFGRLEPGLRGLRGEIGFGGPSRASRDSYSKYLFGGSSPPVYYGATERELEATASLAVPQAGRSGFSLPPSYHSASEAEARCIGAPRDGEGSDERGSNENNENNENENDYGHRNGANNGERQPLLPQH